MKKYIFITSLLFTFTLVSCSSEDSSSIDESIPFYQNLKVDYNVSKNETNVFANFNKKSITGENIELSGNSSIRFNNQEPNFSTLGLYFYTYRFSVLEDVAFTFKRANNTYVNKASLKEIAPITIPTTLTSIDMGTTSVFSWEGAPVGVGEEVQIRIATDSGESNFYNSTVGGTSVEIRFSQPLKVGNATFYISRTKALVLQESNLNGSGQIKVGYVQEKVVEMK